MEFWFSKLGYTSYKKSKCCMDRINYPDALLKPLSLNWSLSGNNFLCFFQLFLEFIPSFLQFLPQSLIEDAHQITVKMTVTSNDIEKHNKVMQKTLYFITSPHQTTKECNKLY